jgi:protein-L-isoaspartate(D-aspartate) O-methyltransferase
MEAKGVSRSFGRGVVTTLVVSLGIVAVLGVAFGWGRGKKDDSVDETAGARAAMVRRQIEARGVEDDRVLAAMRKVPRHRFVPPEAIGSAYADHPLPIGKGQTISQPYIVALMTSVIRPDAGMKVLEIGTGSGYQAAVLAECVDQVYTIEIIPELGEQAESLLGELGYDNVHVRVGDGFNGWPEEAPFDAVVVTAAPDEIPKLLLDQLAVGGRLVIPVGVYSQELVLVTRTEKGFDRKKVTDVRFVPMTGKALDD